MTQNNNKYIYLIFNNNKQIMEYSLLERISAGNKKKSVIVQIKDAGTSAVSEPAAEFLHGKCKKINDCTQVRPHTVHKVNFTRSKFHFHILCTIFFHICLLLTNFHEIIATNVTFCLVYCWNILANKNIDKHSARKQCNICNKIPLLPLYSITGLQRLIKRPQVILCHLQLRSFTTFSKLQLENNRNIWN